MKKNQQKRRVKILLGVLYMLCLLNITGISLCPERAVQSVENKAVSENMDVEAEDYTDGRKVAITFDDGPSTEYTGKLLDGLKARNVKASFFLIGESAKEHPELVERLQKEGHLIGNHTYNHVNLTRLSREEAKKELAETDRAISKITGEHVAYMRPPFGAWQEDLEVEMEVMPVMWTVDTLDT